MRAQRRAPVTVTLTHGAASTVVDGAIFEPVPPGPQNIDQAQPVYLTGAFNLPGIWVAEAGDTLLVGEEEWQVLSTGIVWLDRTRVPVAAGTMPDRVSLRVPGGSGSGWSDVNNRTEVTPNDPFATGVLARVQAVGGAAGNEPAVADDMVTVAGYRVSVPLTADGADQLVVDGERNTLIDVTSSPDPLLVGKTLRVTDLVRGTHRFERTLLCTLND